MIAIPIIRNQAKIDDSFRRAHQRRSGIQISLCKGRFRVRVFDAFRDDEVACHAATGEARMQSTNWAPEHCEALRENLAKGMSYSEIAGAITAKFTPAYTRHAAIGRARRMGLAGAD